MSSTRDSARQALRSTRHAADNDGEYATDALACAATGITWALLDVADAIREHTARTTHPTIHAIRKNQR